jgi:bifunctional N-acetylglucosamine-1-phosphate-uridyltransferase/glucosamine-1-phosphate-acetyltransferase GlmU-like protein
MIVPAAGLGKRLQSPVPKVLQPVNGRPMIDHLLDMYAPVLNRFIVVVHPAFEAAVRRHCEGRLEDIAFASQEAPSGMLDAILAPHEAVRAADPERVWITWCDQVAIHPDTVCAVKRLSDERPAPSIVLPTTWRKDPYIHLARSSDSRFVTVLHRREGDAMPEYGESDAGLFSLSSDAYLRELPAFSVEARGAARTGERNFLPFIPWLSTRGALVRTCPCRDEREAVGVNTAGDLQEVQRYLAQRRPTGAVNASSGS